MKKLLLLASVTLMLVGSSFAGNAELFLYDQEAIEAEMANLNSLENFVLENPGVNLDDMLASNNILVQGMSEASAFYGLNHMNEKAFGIGGFLWGCCLGPAGVLIVWLVADDPGETRKSIVGCIINALLGGGGAFFYNR